jgi:hypothetical protein
VVAAAESEEIMTHGRRTALAVLMLATALGAAACQKPANGDGIATAGGTPPTTNGAGGAVRAAAVDPYKWIRCLREQGVTVEEDPNSGKPEFDERSVGAERLRAALKTCQRFNPNWGKPPPRRTPAELKQLRRFARCMRAHGIEADDPNADPTDDSRGLSLDPNAPSRRPIGSTVPEPVFNQALEDCRSEAPGLVAGPQRGPKDG